MILQMPPWNIYGSSFSLLSLCTVYFKGTGCGLCQNRSKNANGQRGWDKSPVSNYFLIFGCHQQLKGFTYADLSALQPYFLIVRRDDETNSNELPILSYFLPLFLPKGQALGKSVVSTCRHCSLGYFFQVIVDLVQPDCGPSLLLLWGSFSKILMTIFQLFVLFSTINKIREFSSPGAWQESAVGCSDLNLLKSICQRMDKWRW